MFLIILFVQIASFFVCFVPLPYCLTRLGVGDALAMLWPLCVYVCVHVCVYIRPLCIALLQALQMASIAFCLPCSLVPCLPNKALALMHFIRRN